MSKNLLFVTRNFYPSTLGGPSNTLYWLASALVNRNINVKVICTNDHIPNDTVILDEWCKVDGIDVRYISVNSKDKFQWQLYRHIRKEIKWANIVVLSSIFYIPSFVSAYQALWNNKRIIWSPRGELFESALSNKRGKKGYLRLLKMLFASKACFHATSIEEQIQIKTFFGKDVQTFILPNYLRLPIRQEHQPHDQYLLYIGRIAPIKALDKLIRGLARSGKFITSSCKLQIVGGIEEQFKGYYEQLLEITKSNHLEEKIIFQGVLTNTEKEKAYANAHASILVSYSENFGNVVVEALAQGTPVIASKGTPWACLIPSEAGYWIDNDEDNIAKCVDELLSLSPVQYAKMRVNALVLAKEFDIKMNIDKWIKIIE